MLRVRASSLEGLFRQYRVGFTLIELITATAVMGILVAMVGGGLISVMESSGRKEAELDRKHELNRAADFIVDDVLAGAKVSTRVTMSGPNGDLFEITYADLSPPVAYFVTPQGDSRWKGPYVLRRKVAGQDSVALVDGISARSPLCLAGAGSTKRQAGIHVTIESERQLKICLSGLLVDNEVMTLSRTASLRN